MKRRWHNAIAQGARQDEPGFNLDFKSHVPSRRPSRRRGFTLIEAAMTTVIVGVGFMAMLQLLAAGTASNLQGAESTTGVNLAKNVREMALKLPYAHLTTLNGKSYSPPVDARGTTLSEFTGWTQTCKVQAVDPVHVTTDIIDSAPEAVRLTVTVSHNGQFVTDVSWYAFDGTP